MHHFRYGCKLNNSVLTGNMPVDQVIAKVCGLSSC